MLDRLYLKLDYTIYTSSFQWFLFINNFNFYESNATTVSQFDEKNLSESMLKVKISITA